MARPSKFTDEALLAAATALKEAGKEVTGYALAIALEGGRPSSLAERFLELSAVKAPIEPLPALPEKTQTLLNDITTEIQQKLVDELTQAHAELEKQAFSRVASTEAKAQADIEKFKTELDDAMELLGGEKDRAVAAEDKLQVANETIAQLRTELAQAKGELAATRTAHDKLASTVVAKLDSMTPLAATKA